DLSLEFQGEVQVSLGMGGSGNVVLRHDRIGVVVAEDIAAECEHLVVTPAGFIEVSLLVKRGREIVIGPQCEWVPGSQQLETSGKDALLKLAGVWQVSLGDQDTCEVRHHSKHEGIVGGT